MCFLERFRKPAALSLRLRPEDIDDALTGYLASTAHTEADTEAIAIATTHTVLPLYLDWVGAVVLDRQGRLGFVAWDDPARLEPLTDKDRHIVIPARVRGAERFPAVGGLRPHKTPTCRECPSCGGTGRLLIAGKPLPDNVMCQCGNLGWLPPQGAETL